ncbi:MAG: biotin/lipoyl-binding protein, partial [Bryobacteraceae bacterium]
MSHNRFKLVAIAALLVGAMFATVGCSREGEVHAGTRETSKVVTVAVSRVERHDLSQSLRVAAEFRPFQEIDVHAKVAGFVKEIYVDVGSRVRKGQTLAV